jgi:regulatory protein
MNLQAIQSYCAYQERCHSEVRSRLLELGFRGADVEEALAALVADDFLNEERFARTYVRGKFKYNQWGRQKIVSQLKQKKISEYCIKKGLLEIDEEEYEHMVMALLTKKWDALIKESNPWIRKQKVQRYLLQKGFESTYITAAIAQMQ